MQRVLVVDDDRLVADTISLVFRANGFEAEATYSAAEGLERARTFDPELLLMDITMPERTGLELAEDMHRERPGCKLLLLTAYSSNLAKVQSMSAQMKRELRVLSKPVRPEELLEHASEMLRQSA
jgi:CheY-like chemotaxis protein